jgi:hypothetical protein
LRLHSLIVFEINTDKHRSDLPVKVLKNQAAGRNNGITYLHSQQFRAGTVGCQNNIGILCRNLSRVKLRAGEKLQIMLKIENRGLQREGGERREAERYSEHPAAERFQVRFFADKRENAQHRENGNKTYRGDVEIFDKFSDFPAVQGGMFPLKLLSWLNNSN